MTSTRSELDPFTPDEPAEEQEDEQDRLNDGARDLLRDDPGDPKDRLSIIQEERLMEQQPQRDFHA
jgi:hypothetical protein